MINFWPNAKKNQARDPNSEFVAIDGVLNVIVSIVH